MPFFSAPPALPRLSVSTRPYYRGACGGVLPLLLISRAVILESCSIILPIMRVSCSPLNPGCIAFTSVSIADSGSVSSSNLMLGLACCQAPVGRAACGTGAGLICSHSLAALTARVSVCGGPQRAGVFEDRYYQVY